MKSLDLSQGSPEWLTAREGQLTASLAPAMMGVGYQSRDKAMRSFLGLSEPEELTPFVKNMFEQGHISEANARPLAEKLIGESLSPITGTREHCEIMFFASFDGLTFDNKLVWEHKMTGKVFSEIPPLYYWQLEHQMIVANTENALLTVTDLGGNITHRYYTSVPQKRVELVDGWSKWLEDCSDYERTDSIFLDVAEEYIALKHEVDVRSYKLKETAKKLQDLAGNKNASGGGIKVTVFAKNNKQSPSSYIKENDIELPEIDCSPELQYRITINKKEQ